MNAGNDDNSVNYRLPENTLMIDRCTKAGLNADSLYCNAYHKCGSQGQDEQYLCENQLLFNPESNICDYPINVVCGGRGHDNDDLLENMFIASSTREKE